MFIYLKYKLSTLINRYKKRRYLKRNKSKKTYIY